MFGRGQRWELDEEDTVVLAAQIRESIKGEVIGIKETEGVNLCEGWGDGGDSRLEERGKKESNGDRGEGKGRL